MTRNRRIAWLTVLLLLLAGVGAGIAWYVRRQTGPRLLARAQLALRANKLEKSLELAGTYAAKYPADWRGYHTQALAYCRQGRYLEARRVLDKAARCDPNAAEVVLCRASTYSLPAVRTLASRADREKAEALHDAIAKLEKANEILRQSKGRDAAPGLGLQERWGLNLRAMARAQLLLSGCLDREAEIAAAARVTPEAEAKREESQEALAASKESLKQAIAALLAVVQEDPRRPASAEALIELCQKCGDEASLALARKALDVDDPPPVAASMLAVHELRSSHRQGKQAFRKQLGKVKRDLDKLLSAHPDNARIKLERAAVALTSAEVFHDPNEAKLAERLAQESTKAEPHNSRARLLHARALMSQRRHQEAERELFALKADVSGWHEAHYFYAIAAHETGKTSLAAEAMRTIVSRIKPDHVPSRMYLARLTLRESPRQAFEDAAAAYDADPNSPEVLRLFVQAARRTDQPGLARTALDVAGKTEGAGLSLLMAAADGYRILGDGTRARKLESRVAGGKPVGAGDRQAVVRAMVRTGRVGDADKLLEEQFQKDPNDPDAHIALARHYYDTRRGLQAMEHCRRAVDLDGRAPEYRLMLAGLLAESGELDEALAILEPIRDASKGAQDLEVRIKIRQGQPVDAEAWRSGSGAAGRRGLSLALAYLRAGQPQRCIETCQAELAQRGPDDDDPTPHLLLGQAYRAMGRADECVEAWSAGISAKPGALGAYLPLALFLSRNAEPEKVRERLEEVPAARKEMIGVALAGLHVRRGEFLQAAALYAKAAGDPQIDEHIGYLARLEGARALTRAGKGEEALGELDKLIEQDVQPERTLAAKADILMRMRRLPEAEAALGELLAKAGKSRNVRAIERIALALARIERAEKALAAVDAVQQIRPDDPRTCVLRARVLQAIGKTDEIPQLLRKAIELQPARPDLHVMLSDALDARQDPLAALEALRELAGRGRAAGVMARYQEGRLLARWGLRKKATEQLEGLVDSASSPAMQLDLARALASLDGKPKAKALLTRIPEHAPQYAAAQHALADLAETQHALAILRSLAAKRPGDPATLMHEMSILLEDDRPAEARQAFRTFRASKEATGQSIVGPAAMAIQAAVRTKDLASAARISAAVVGVTGNPRWRWLAVALGMDGDPQAAGKLLPPPAEADLIPAALGLCLASRSADAAAAKPWAERIDDLDLQAAKLQPPGAVPVAYRLPCALLARDELQVKVIAKKLDTAGGPVAAAGRELIAHAGASQDARKELVKLLKAQVALDARQVDLAWHWAMEALKARPACQWAARLLYWASAEPERLEQLCATLQPKDSYLARRMQARLHVAKQQYDDAVGIYRALARTHGDDKGLSLEHAQAEERAGNLKQAQPLYRKVFEATKDPVCANNWAYLVTVLSPADRERLAEAQKVTDGILKPNSPSMFLDTAGWIAHLQGRKADACRLLRRAVKGQPGSAEVHYHLGMAEAAAGSNRLARMHLEEAVDIGRRRAAEAREKDRRVPLAERRAARLAEHALREIEPLE